MQHIMVGGMGAWSGPWGARGGVGSTKLMGEASCPGQSAAALMSSSPCCLCLCLPQGPKWALLASVFQCIHLSLVTLAYT